MPQRFPVISELYTYVKPYKKWFYASVVLALLMAVTSPVRPYLIQQTLSVTTSKNVSGILRWLPINFIEKPITSLILSITIFQIVFIFIETAIRFAFSFLTAKLGQLVVKDLRVAVFNRIVNFPLQQFDTTPVGTLSTRTINDIESINEIFSDGLIPIIADLLTIVFTLATMCNIDWKLTLIALIPFPALIIGTYYFKESVKNSFIKVRNAVAALNTFVQEHLSGMAIVQAFTTENAAYKKFKAINNEHKKANIKAIFAYSVFFPLIEVVLAISVALIVWWVSNKAIQQPNLSVELSGKIVAFVLFMNQIFRPLRVIADKFNVLQMGIIAGERVLAVINKEAENIGAVNQATNNGNPVAVEFKNVNFQYLPNTPVLKKVSFTVPKGEVLAIVGSTGSGKTSIISALNKLYPIQQGEILLDKKNIDDFNLQELRQKIGVVLQDVFLFSGSVLDNITLHNPNISLQQVQQAAHILGLDSFIEKLPNGYNYNVMERGNTLSLGQRQLISFIRTILYNPGILVLDEATSSIDTETEQLIQKAIDTLVKGRTSIIIAHRLSTIQKANTIMLLDKGEIKEMGTHSQLLALKGMYYSLHKKQANEVG